MSTAESRAERLALLAALSDTDEIRDRVAQAAPIIEQTIEATGLTPGLYLDECDELEVRWVIRPNPDVPAQIVNVTFSPTTASIYVYSRTSGSVITEIDVPVDGDRLAQMLGVLIEHAVDQQTHDRKTP